MGKISITIDDWVQDKVESHILPNKSARYQELIIRGLHEEEIEQIKSADSKKDCEATA